MLPLAHEGLFTISCDNYVQSFHSPCKETPCSTHWITTCTLLCQTATTPLCWCCCCFVIHRISATDADIQYNLDPTNASSSCLHLFFGLVQFNWTLILHWLAANSPCPTQWEIRRLRVKGLSPAELTTLRLCQGHRRMLLHPAGRSCTGCREYFLSIH